MLLSNYGNSSPQTAPMLIEPKDNRLQFAPLEPHNYHRLPWKANGGQRRLERRPSWNDGPGSIARWVRRRTIPHACGGSLPALPDSGAFGWRAGPGRAAVGGLPGVFGGILRIALTQG